MCVVNFLLCSTKSLVQNVVNSGNIVLLLQVVKQTVMTVVYGVTWVGGRRQVEVIYFSWKFFVCRNLGTVYTIE